MTKISPGRLPSSAPWNSYLTKQLAYIMGEVTEFSYIYNPLQSEIINHSLPR
jgi:hypothetical protein